MIEASEIKFEGGQGGAERKERTEEEKDRWLDLLSTHCVPGTPSTGTSSSPFYPLLDLDSGSDHFPCDCNSIPVSSEKCVPCVPCHRERKLYTNSKGVALRFLSERATGTKGGSRSKRSPLPHSPVPSAHPIPVDATRMIHPRGGCPPLAPILSYINGGSCCIRQACQLLTVREER